jgi:7,8-dihydro-6-hydroxymethylpterin dimethyltransferase
MKLSSLKTRKLFASSLSGPAIDLAQSEKNTLLNALSQTRQRMGKFFKENQILGRKGSIGCVSLEISQRCNLDCSLCYLSESSNYVDDIPFQEVKNRLDNIRNHFGVGTNVQISGGDPTLRDRVELVAIVKYAREIGLLPALFTNGIKCSRNLLVELAQNGLSDVAFHVDLTRERKGYKTERDLNAVRLEYINKTSGLPLMVVFNTTVFEGNFHEINDLAKFFAQNADTVDFASFQLQADTGRGILKDRPNIISTETIREKINHGVGSKLSWDSILVGHPKCHSYVPTFAINGKCFEIIDDAQLFGEFLEDFSHITHDRRENFLKIGWQYLKAASQKPSWYIKGLKYFLPKLWHVKGDLLKAKGKINKISFFVQNFMDKNNLDMERIDACSFVVMTHDGPVSMCLHNSKRDDYILKPFLVESEKGLQLYQPLKEN